MRKKRYATYGVYAVGHDGKVHVEKGRVELVPAPRAQRTQKVRATRKTAKGAA
jgi:hypothetical protein